MSIKRNAGRNQKKIFGRGPKKQKKIPLFDKKIFDYRKKTKGSPLTFIDLSGFQGEGGIPPKYPLVTPLPNTYI